MGAATTRHLHMQNLSENPTPYRFCLANMVRAMRKEENLILTDDTANKLNAFKIARFLSIAFIKDEAKVLNDVVNFEE